MAAPDPVRLDGQVQAAYLPAETSLFLWRATGEPFGHLQADLWLAGASVHTAGRKLSLREAVGVFDAQLPEASATVGVYATLTKLARSLLRRGSLRPRVTTTADAAALRWSAALDAEERSVLATIVEGAPPAAFAGGPVDGTAWRTARAFVDGVLDHLIRSAGVRAGLAPETFEGVIERGLLDPSGLRQQASVSTRVRRALGEWERAAHDRETPRTRLVLQLDPPVLDGAPFTLSFAVEVRDPTGILGPVGAAEIWSESLAAHRLVDDLTPLKGALKALLHKAGAIVAPVEASLASGAPAVARLSPTEAWSVLVPHRAELEAAGARLAVNPALEGVSDRFPRPRLSLARGDGLPPETVTLGSKYRAEWGVTTSGVALTAAELRTASAHAPLVRVRDLWVAITSEAGERLARLAERPAAEWTGPQALAAALAGEVRLAGDLSDAAVRVEPGLERLLEELKADVRVIPVPAELRAKLRHYQERGVAWLHHRVRLGLGALLADDMGLGKTVQLIALLLLLRQEEAAGQGAPTLLICPASLVGNWERELGRFAPDLRVVRHHGGARHRDAAQLRAEAGPHDVVLTTYSLVRRDAEMLAGVEWGTVACDEAQNLKNPSSAQARAVRSLPARRRVGLSGTPVENRLTELWSLMEFLNPGLLGPLDRFRREIALPIERERDARAMRWLRAATAPFLLRRLKTDPDIAPELPEKEIIRVFCSLTEEQARLYKEAVDRSLSALDDLAGIERSGRVLKLLTELKQICNHPAHYLGDDSALAGRSGKLDRAAEMLEEIVESGERALVFTQYVEMGTRLCRYLEQRLSLEAPFFHGGLGLPARDAMVRRFQEAADGPPILVLSLRAGGVGLNLTRATHVLHFDRWWNPAVEDQATDRAHRIGQTQRVQVHHLITIGTLEERIDRMLEDKRGLAESVVTGGEAWITQLSTDELRALVSLGSDAAVESLESLDAAS